jgi:hypothetical protein
MELFGLITFILFLVLNLIFFVVYKFGKKRNSKTLKLIGGVPLGIGLSLFIAFFSFAGVHLILICFPSYVFSDAFGFKPPLEISGLQSRVHYDDTYIQFKAPPGVVKKILTADFCEIDRKSFEESLGGNVSGLGAPPDWWKPFNGKPKKFYENKHLINDAVLSYDELTGVVHFYWLHID